MSIPRLRLVRNVKRASASVLVGNVCSDWKLERSLSNIGPGPCIGVVCDKNWKYAPRPTQSDTRNGTRSTSTSLEVSRMLAMGHDWPTACPEEYATVRAMGVFGVPEAYGFTAPSARWCPPRV